MMTMTMRLKFAGTSADEGFTDIFWKPLNLMGRDNVLEDRTMAHQEVRDAEVRAQDLRTKGIAGYMAEDARSGLWSRMRWRRCWKRCR